MKNGSVGNFKLNDNDNLVDSEFESKPPNRAGVFRMVYGWGTSGRIYQLPVWVMLMLLFCDNK